MQLSLKFSIAMLFFTLIFTSFLAIALAQKNPHYLGDRTTMVHLFEWKFNDIAKECENFLGPNGYGGVQVSPVNENIIIKDPNRPWYERYQPMSYKIISRSGNETEFKNMVKRCNKVGVRIYVDIVINHMTANIQPAYGISGASADPEQRRYPGVPYGPENFHKLCPINNYQNATEVRVCELKYNNKTGLHDLNQTEEYVRDKIIEFSNKLIDCGIAGFRVDAAKHMWPEDLKIIYKETKNLSTEHGYYSKSRAYIYQEVIDSGDEAVSKFDYIKLANVIEFLYGVILGKMFRGQDELARLQTLNNSKAWRLLSSSDALVMIDNHDNQRGNGIGADSILTYKDPKPYKMAVAFMLAYPYGHTRVMSSFAFTDPSQGPPANSDGEIISPEISKEDGQCTNGWVCEHRWPQIYHMVKFRNIVKGEQLKNWWSNGKNQIAFARGNKGFVAFTVEGDLNEELQTGLPSGTYCDVITGEVVDGKCSGKSVTVYENGTALINIPSNGKEGVMAIHMKAKL